MDKLKYKARAKVNLGLDVCGRLPNGYHKVKMIMQTIDLYDELEFNKRKDPDIILSVDSKDPLGDIGNNLIFRAAKLMKEYYSIKEGIEIHLKKHIPVAAGMAGGSTDAAATMLAMNELFELGQTREQLMEQALRIGADIPFCIQEQHWQKESGRSLPNCQHRPRHLFWLPNLLLWYQPKRCTRA